MTPEYSGDCLMLSRITRWVSADVDEKYEGRRSGRSARVVNEKGSGAGSLSCLSRHEKSMDEARRRGGVPVFIRPVSKPRILSWLARPTEASSPARPDGVCEVPICTRPFKKVPVVIMT